MFMMTEIAFVIREKKLIKEETEQLLESGPTIEGLPLTEASRTRKEAQE